MSAFEGTRVLDFSTGIAGRMATMLLADFGADVLRIEPPSAPDLPPEPGGHTWNRNKRRARLDLAAFEGRRRASELLAGADVALFDTRPGELEPLGFDPVTLGARHPALVHAWLPPFGEHGRWSQLTSDHLLLSALSGVAWQQMSFSDVPVYLVTPQIAYGHATIAANAIAAALIERCASGRGQPVTVSGLHGVAAVQSGGHLRAEGIMRIAGRSSRGGSPNYRLYECADGLWFFLGCLTPAFFLRALETVDMLDLLTLEGVDGEFMNLMRPPASDAVGTALEARFHERPRAEWLAILKANDVPCGAVGSRADWFHGPTVAANGMRVVLDHPTLGEVAMPGVSAALSETPGSVRSLMADVSVETVDWPSQPAPETEGDAPGAGPLAGVRVLDLGVVIAGTYAPCVLANLGADVIKVEPIEGEIFRPYGLGFVGYNQGKRGLAIDLKHPDGLAAFLDLVRASDVVVDNFRRGVRERLGIDYAALRAVNPRIISCSVTGYGQRGPLSDEPGFDPLVQAQGGLMDAQGGDDEPVFYQIPVNDTGSGMMAAFGILAALHARERTGLGQDVQTSLANQVVMFQSGELTEFAGRTPPLRGGLDFTGPTALRRFYPCSDGWLALAASRPGHFHRVATALGHPEWAGRFVAERALDEPATGPLGTAIADALAAMPRDEAVERLLAHEVPAAPALRPDEMFIDPWSVANRHLWTFHHPQFGTMSAVRAFADYARTPGGWQRRAPLLGEHTVEVLAECGFSEGRIRSLLDAGVIAQGE